MLKLYLQFFGGRGSGGGKSSGKAGGSKKAGGGGKPTEKKTREKKPSGTMSTDKSFDQIQAETQQLQEFPAGTKIEFKNYTGEFQTYVAHDQASMGRNGRMRRLRRYSMLTGSTTPGRMTSDTKDPYVIAQGQWRKM